MTLQLADDPTPDQIRTWKVPNEHRNKADARVAVICTAVKQGAIEFIRFRGEPPPLGYTSPYSLQNCVPESSQKSSEKRKMTEDTHDEPDKPAKRYKKEKVGGVQSSHGQPTVKDTRPKKPGKKKHGSIRTPSVPDSGEVAGNFPGGYISYQPGLGGEGGSGTAFPTSQGGPSSFGISMNHASFPPLMPNQHFMPHLHYPMQSGYPPPLQPYAVTSSSHKYYTHPNDATVALQCDSSDPEPGEVFDVSSGPSVVSDGS